MKRRMRHQRRSSHRLIQKCGTAAALALLLVAFSDSLRVDSGSVSPDTPEQLSIKGGVLTIAPGGANDSVMELGNNGGEIVSTGDIFIRPNGSSSGTRFVGNADQTQDLLLTGKLEVRDGITLGGIRKTVWPAPDHWKPAQDSRGVPVLSLTESTTSISTERLTVTENDGSYVALYVDNNGPGAYAANFNNSDVAMNYQLKATGILVCGSKKATQAERAQECHDDPSFYKPVWTRGSGTNMYLYGGVDADILRGVDAYFVGNCNGESGVVCLCAATSVGASRCTRLK